MYSGLYNQYAALVDIIALARAMSLAVVLPPAVTRREMIVGREMGRAESWYETPFEGLFDVDDLRAGLPEIDFIDTGTIADVAVAACAASVNIRRDTRMQPLDYYSSAVDTAAAAGERVHMHMECAQFSYMPTTAGEIEIVAHIEHAIKFSRALRADAAGIVRELGGPGNYEGFHLRCEADARVSWHFACTQRVVSDPLVSAGIDPKKMLYVATGETALVAAIDKRYRVITHATLGDFAARYGGSLEHVAAIDALVLQSAAHFVGFDFSSFSFFIARWRTLPSYLVSGIEDGGTLKTFKGAFPPSAASAFVPLQIARLHGRGIVTASLCGGLFNQYAALVEIIAVARALDLSVVLPTAVTRHSMVRGARDQGDDDQGACARAAAQPPDAWTAIPLEELFNVEALRAALPEINFVDAATVARYPPPTVVPPHACRRLADFEALLDGAAGDGGVHLHLPCGPFMYAPRTVEERAALTRIEAAMRFNATLVADAAALIQQLGQRSSGGAYSGFHFRCEADARAYWHVNCTSPAVNSAPLKRGGIDPGQLLYVATGERELVRYIDKRYRVVTHADIMDFETRYRGSLEHVAAIDALVLRAASRFVGFGMSSFSFFIARARGAAAATLLDTTVREDPSFARAFPDAAPPGVFNT